MLNWLARHNIFNFYFKILIGLRVMDRSSTMGVMAYSRYRRCPFKHIAVAAKGSPLGNRANLNTRSLRLIV